MWFCPWQGGGFPSHVRLWVPMFRYLIVSIGDLIGRNPFIADVVGILLIIFRGAAAEEVMGVRTNL